MDWIELSSAAHELPTCMYAGAEKNADQSLIGWQRFTPQEWATRSIFTVKQDVKLLNENVVRATLTEPLRSAGGKARTGAAAYRLVPAAHVLQLFRRADRAESGAKWGWIFRANAGSPIW